MPTDVFELVEQPVVTYNLIKVGNTPVTLSGSGRCSFKSPYNNVSITFTPQKPLIQWLVKVTPANAAYDIDVGVLAAQRTNLLAQQYTVNFTLTDSILTQGEGNYRISLYAQNASKAWDVTYFFVGNGEDNFYINNTVGDKLEVPVVKDI